MRSVAIEGLVKAGGFADLYTGAYEDVYRKSENILWHGGCWIYTCRTMAVIVATEVPSNVVLV